MKFNRLISILLCFVLMFSFTGCKKELTPDTSHNYVDEYKSEFYADMKKYEIITDSVPNYCLVLPRDCSELINFAAEEFNNFLNGASGASLPVIYDGDEKPNGISKFISLGKTSMFSDLDLDLDYSVLNNDGFYVKVKDGNYYVVGDTDRGVLYGCYDVLKRFIGLRFINKDFTYYDTSKTVSFAEYEYFCAPEFAQRSFLEYNMVYDPKYAIRTTQYGEFNGDGVVSTPWASELGNIHTVEKYYVKASEWKASHPEFFSSYTNPAADSSINSNAYDDVCYCNGITEDGKLDTSKEVSVASIVIDKIKEYLKTKPDRSFFMLGISDQWNAYCVCDTCVEREEKFGQRSGIMTMFANVVADEINKWRQSDEAKELGIDHEINIIIFAYYWTLIPPVHEENGEWVANYDYLIPNDNVYIRYAPLDANYLYSLGNENQIPKYKDNFEKWSAISDNLMLYDYCKRIGWLTAWYPHLSNMSEQAKYLKEHNLYYWMFESEYSAGCSLWNIDLIRYIVTNLWWDVNADVNALKDEFIEIYNGKTAAPYIKKFVDIMEENNARLKTVGGVVSDVFNNRDITVKNYPRGLLEQAISLMDDAENAIMADTSLTAIEKETYVKRLTEVRVIPESILLLNYKEYYVDGTEKVAAFAQDFYKKAQLIGLVSLGHISVKYYVDSL